ncbi:MAG: response regulator [Candidatus Omnitrophica bacterium]|nr:response regulator [Candidatus Omnitrophota bacterium]
MKKILIIEDNPTLSEIFVKILTPMGFMLLTALTGKTGRELAQQEKPDAIFLNIKLPDTNGIELLQEIKTIVPETFVFMITSVHDQNLEKILKELGAVEVIPKPIHSEKIKTLLSYHLNLINTQATVRTPAKILIVDDEEGICFFIKTALNLNFKCDVTTAFNGTKGMELLKTNQFDLAICDIKVPEMSGLDVIEQAIKEGVKTKYLIISGYNSKDVIEQAAKLGAIYYFQKPFETKDLIEKVKIILMTMNKYIPKKE